MSSVVGAAAVEDLHQLLGEHGRELLAAQLAERGIAERVPAPIAVLVGEDDVQVPAVAERPVRLEAVDGDPVVGLVAQPSSSKRSILTSFTAGGSNVSSEVLFGLATRAGRYSNHA